MLAAFLNRNFSIKCIQLLAGVPPDGYDARLLRQHVVHLLERVARSGMEVACQEVILFSAKHFPCAFEAFSNFSYVAVTLPGTVHVQLQRLLGEHVLEPEVVLLLAPALGRVLERAPPEAHSVLAALPVLAQGIKQQQHSAALARVLAGPAEFLEARSELLHLLASLLAGRSELQRAAVRGWDTVAAVFGLLRDASMRAAALRLVSQSFSGHGPTLP